MNRAKDRVGVSLKDKKLNSTAGDLRRKLNGEPGGHVLTSPCINAVVTIHEPIEVSDSVLTNPTLSRTEGTIVTTTPV
jgi:hypothetical protein